MEKQGKSAYSFYDAYSCYLLCALSFEYYIPPPVWNISSLNFLSSSCSDFVTRRDEESAVAGKIPNLNFGKRLNLLSNLYTVM